MTIKKLTAEGRFECGLDEFVRGKVWAFVAVPGNHTVARLGIAVANEGGYTPIPETWANADNFAEMEEHAAELNRAEGLDAMQEIKIVCSTMGKKVRAA